LQAQFEHHLTPITWVLMNGSQITNLIHYYSFGHNLNLKFSMKIVSLFFIFMLEKLFNSIKRAHFKKDLLFALLFQKMKTSMEFQLSKWILTWECHDSLDSIPYTPSHF
jgi:hypothetical protein